MGVSPGNGTSATSVGIIYSGDLLRPAIVRTQAAAFLAAATLSRKGTSALRTFIEENIQWPREGSPEDIALQAGIAELIQYWEDEFADGFDPSSVEDDDPDRYDECDRLVIRWLADSHMPGGRELIFELAWPDTLAAVTKDAQKYFPEAVEKKIDEEELSSHRVGRWMTATSPFKAGAWVVKEGLWESYRAWSAADGNILRENNAEMGKFYKALESFGCHMTKRGKVRGYYPPRELP